MDLKNDIKVDKRQTWKETKMNE